MGFSLPATSSIAGPARRSPPLPAAAKPRSMRIAGSPNRTVSQPLSPQKGPSTDMTQSHSITVTDASFKADVLESTMPVLVDFWAQWCGPCRAVAPGLEPIAAETAQRLTLAKLDVDANPLTAQQYQVVSIPTLILFKD